MTSPVSPERLKELIATDELNERTLYFMQQNSVSHAAAVDRLSALRELEQARKELETARELLRKWRATADVAMDLHFVPVAKRTDDFLSPTERNKERGT